MKGMLKSELFKFKSSYALWIIIGVITASCFISILTGIFNSAEMTLANIAKDSMVPILACAVYGAIILTDDFSNGLLQHYIASGYKRSSIVLAKLIHYILGSSILLLVYPCLCIFLTALLHGTQTTLFLVLQEMMRVYLRTLPLYWGIFGLFFLLAVFIQKGVITMGVSVAASIILVVFTNKLYDGQGFILKYSPVIQIGEAASGPVTGPYLLSALLSLAILAACVSVSILKFNKDEM